MSNLMLHCGAKPATFHDLCAMDSDHFKPMTPTHKPLPHREVATRIKRSIIGFTDYSIVAEEYGISHKGKNCFGVMSLKKNNDQHNDYEIFYAWRHSNNMMFGLRAGIGSRVFVCDNMAFSVESEIQGCKHTANIEDTFDSRITDLNKTLLAKDQELHDKYDRYKNVRISYRDADHVIMQSVRAGALPKTKVTAVDAEWRDPSFKYDSNGISLWDLFNAFTYVNQGTFYGDQIKRTQKLHKVFDEYPNYSHMQI